MSGPIVIHSLAHARAAVAAAEALGKPVTLYSAPDAASQVGPGWFREVVARARAEHPRGRVRAVLDCGRAPGLALASLRAGIEEIHLDAPTEIRDKVAAIARRGGGRLIERTDTPVLDLLDAEDPGAACRSWLAGLDAAGGKR